MSPEAQEAMIRAGLKDPGFARLMGQIYNTYARARSHDIGRGVEPGFEGETRATRRIVGAIAFQSSRF